MSVLAWDVGTSGVKAVVVDRDGRVVASARRGYGLATGNGGWVEQDLDEMETACIEATREILDGGVPASEVDGIGLTAQMFDLAPVDACGVATAPMISWLDQRATTDADQLAGRIGRDEQFGLFGSIITGKDLIPKVLWLRDRAPAAWDATRWLLDCKEALVLRLTGRAVIDPGGALAFRLYDPVAGRWSMAACERLGIPIDRLPDVAPATSIAGGLLPSLAERLGLAAGIPVIVGAGDVAASQLGAGATDPGDAHVSLGTAVYFGVTTDRPVIDPAGQLGVIGHADPRLWILWLEVATGGGALAWLLRALGDGSHPSAAALVEVSDRVSLVADEMDGLLFTPWLSGERVPVFDDQIRGAFSGLSLRHGRAHLVRAVMEGVAYQMRWALDYGAAYGVPIGQIRGVGGGFIGATWTQIIADVIDRPIACIDRPQDAAAVGAAACALVGVGAQSDLRFIRERVRVARPFEPDPMRRAVHDDGYDRFRRLYDALSALSGGSGSVPSDGLAIAGATDDALAAPIGLAPDAPALIKRGPATR